jgi:FkbM family methyltransferase
MRDNGLQVNGVIDGGAAYGDFTVDCRTVYPRAEYILIEPLLDRYRQSPNSKLDSLASRGARLVQACVSDRPGTVTLNVHADLVGSSLLRETDGPAVDGEPVEVPAATIDHLVGGESFPAPVLLKLDLQGAELQALGGSERTLERTAAVMLEATMFDTIIGSPSFLEVVGFMADRGFVVYDLLNPLYRPLDGALSQIDVIFTREDGALRRRHGYATPAQRRASDQALLQKR